MQSNQPILINEASLEYEYPGAHRRTTVVWAPIQANKVHLNRNKKPIEKSKRGSVEPKKDNSYIHTIFGSINKKGRNSKLGNKKGNNVPGK